MLNSLELQHRNPVQTIEDIKSYLKLHDLYSNEIDKKFNSIYDSLIYTPPDGMIYRWYDIKRVLDSSFPFNPNNKHSLELHKIYTGKEYVNLNFS